MISHEGRALSRVLRDIMTEEGVDIHEVANRCGVTYQTVKNVLDGNSVNARFINNLVQHFAIDKDRTLLRRLLLSFLLLQFPENDGELLRKAKLIE